jgi:hypothetical protein
MAYNEIRRYRRASTGPGYSVQFRARDHFFMGLSVASLGAGGCSVKISVTLAASLKPEDPLSRLLLLHPDLPRVPLEGRISWIRGRQPNLEENALLMGIEFISLDEDYARILDDYVVELLKAGH